MKRSVLLMILYSAFAVNLYGQSADESNTDETIIVQGRVLNEKTNEPVKAELDIYFDSDFILDDVRLTDQGEYSETLKKYGWYIINVSAPGFLNKTDTLWIIDDSRKVITRDHHLTPIEVGLSVVLNNVYFYFGQTILKEDSYPSLNLVAEFFKDNPQVIVEIGGHTDDEGDEVYNQMLSEGRAKAVVEYLVKQGIDPNRITGKGYGEANPIDHGITKAAKARNRRVEFIVVGVGS